MQKSIIKIASILLIIGLNWTGLSAVLETRAYFNDTEISSENSSSAGTLDFSLSDSGDFSPSVTPSNPTAIKNISIQNEGSLSLKYQIKFDNVSGDLCNYVTLKAELEGIEKYNGPIIEDQNLLSEPLPVLNKDEKDDWIFTATFTGSDPGLQNQTCTFDFVFDGEQLDSSSGFSDSEEITNLLQSGGLVISPGDVVINEVEYDTQQPGTDAAYEWFELYNNTSLPVTLSGWTITDNNAADTIPDLTIAPQGFAVVAASSTGFATNYPGFSGTIVYIPDGIIGNGLSNTGDRLILKKADGVEIDAVSWLNDDYAFGAGNGVTPATGAGHSIARKTKGIDTNSPDDWQKLITPNPGTNPHLISGEEIVTEEFIINEEEVVEGDPTEELENEVVTEEEPVIIDETTTIEEIPVVEEESVVEEPPIIEEPLVVVEEPVTIEQPALPADPQAPAPAPAE